MALHIQFNPLKLEDLARCAEEHKNEGYRCVQMLCVNTDEGIDMQYTFMKDDTLENFTIRGVTKDTNVPSITNHYLSAFVFENEAHDLFGVNIVGNLLDFGGNFYAVSEKEPMTFISPEQKAAREKAAKIAAAKAAKAAQAAKVKAEEDSTKATEPAIDQATIDEKTKGLDPEKAAKVKAAMEAKAARASKATETQEDIQESGIGKKGEQSE